MQTYSISLAVVSCNEPSYMEFTAKDDLAASAIAKKLAKTHKAAACVLSRKTSHGWLKISEDKMS